MTGPIAKQAVALKTPERWGTSSASFYCRLEGEPLVMQLITGEQVTGVLLGVDRYDVFVEQADGQPVLVSKGAIAWVRRAVVSTETTPVQIP